MQFHVHVLTWLYIGMPVFRWWRTWTMASGWMTSSSVMRSTSRCTCTCGATSRGMTTFRTGWVSYRVYSIRALGWSDPLFCTYADPTNSGYIIKYSGSRKWTFFCNNQYRIVTLYFHFNLDYHFYLFNHVASAHNVMYTLTTGTSAHVTSFLPMRWAIGVWSLSTRHVYYRSDSGCSI